MLRLWRNECLRIFHDRLINQEDKTIVVNQITDLISSKYSGAAEHVLADPSVFGDFRYAAHKQCCAHNVQLHHF
jgi:dynein heavy chain, axonemal